MKKKSVILLCVNSMVNKRTDNGYESIDPSYKLKMKLMITVDIHGFILLFSKLETKNSPYWFNVMGIFIEQKSYIGRTYIEKKFEKS